MDKVAQIGTTDYYSLQEAVNAVTNGGTIKMRTDITLAEAVIIASGESKSFTLDIRGNTLDSGSSPAIEHRGVGTLTIFDSEGYGRITSITAGSGTILLIGGSLAISGGTVENTAAGNGISNDGSGRVSILCGRSTIRGGNMAMNVAPDLSSYTDVKITASSTSTSGKDASEIILEYIDTDAEVQAYKFLRFEQGLHNVVRIGSKGYTSLQGAVYAATNGDTIELLEDITLADTVIISASSLKSFTLDLRGKTLDGSTNTAIKNASYGTLTITDTGKGGMITSANTNITNGTLYVYQGSLVVSGGTVENTSSGGSTIVSNSEGTVSVTGGTVRATEGTAIYNGNTGKVTIDGVATVISTKADSGFVPASDTGTIYLKDGLADIPVLEITGGTVENTTTGIAIYNNGTGKIKISGTAIVKGSKVDSGTVSTSDTGTIYLKEGVAGNTVLEIKGGSIENTTSDNAIYNTGSGNVSISSGMVSANNGTAICNHSTGKIIISGTSTIRGGTMAMNVVPDLSYYSNVQIMASINNADGIDASEISRDSIDTDGKVQVYKYLKLGEAKVAQIGTTSYTSLKAAIDAVPDGGTIELLRNITLTAAVATGNNSFTLDLKGKTMDGGVNTAIDHWGKGTLTITDTVGDGKIISTYKDGATIVNSGTLNIAGGTVIGSTGTAINNYKKVIISGGTVKNISEGRGIFNFEAVEVTGGMVSAENGIAIDNFGYGSSVNASGGTVSAKGDYAMLNRGEGKITISDTALVTNEGTRATIYLMHDNPYGYTLTIKGGTVENTGEGEAINNSGYGHVEIFGGTVSSTAGTAIYTLIGTSEVFILEGTSTIIKGGYRTMNKFPVFYEYDNVRIRVSKTDGTDTSEVLLWYFLTDKKKFESYKYLRFEPATVPDPPTNLGATPLNGCLSLTWDAPANNGGREIIGYKISTDNGSSWTVTYSIYNPRNVYDLTNGASYTVLVRAFNEIGDGPVSDSITVTLPVPTYTIKGSIKDRDTNSGIPGAVVQLMNGNSKVGSPVFTDSNGDYTIFNVIGGTYSIEVSSDGYDSGTVSSFYVSYNATNKNLMLTLIPAPVIINPEESSPPIGNDDNESSPVGDPGNSPVSEIGYSPVDDKGNTLKNDKRNITVIITEKNLADALDKAMADANKKGNEQKEITLVLNVSTGNKNANNVTINLPKVVQETIINSKVEGIIVVVDNPDIRIGMDLATIKEINKQAGSDVKIIVTRSGKLIGSAKKAIGSRPVFDLKVNYGSGKSIQNFGEGSISIAIPYTLGTKEKAGNVCAVYVDNKGKVHWLSNSVYDSTSKMLRFSTSHFSTYGVGYIQEAYELTDISTHWAKDDIEFVVSRGLISGTSTTTFSPNTAMTKGVFVTALGQLADADVSRYRKSSFTDVRNDAYYMGYIEWAYQNNILSGTGNGNIIPNQPITREQMAVIMQKYAKVIGFTLPKIYEEISFADSAKISTDAKEAVKQLQMAGVISSNNDNRFDPQRTATRAEVSAVLRRFVELVISSVTM